MSVAGDATDNCTKVDDLLDEYGVKCGHGITPRRRCDGLVWTTADPEACAEALAARPCGLGGSPTECDYTSTKVPWHW